MTKFLVNIYRTEAVSVPELKSPISKLHQIYGDTLDNVKSIVKVVRDQTKTNLIKSGVSVDAALTGYTNRSVLMKYNKKTCIVYVIEIELV